MKTLSSQHETRVLVVETGAAEGLWRGPGVVLRERRRGVVPFLQTALNHVREHAQPDDWVVRVDADDFYGPRYLEGVESVRLRGGEGTGIPSVYLRTEDNQLYFCQSKRSFRGACGGTLAARVGSLVDFRDSGNAWGEDSLWVEDMLAAGRRMLPRDSRDYAFTRHDEGEHTYPLLGHEIPHCWNCDAYLLGGFTESKVGKLFEPTGLPIPPDIARMGAAAARAFC